MSNLTPELFAKFSEYVDALYYLEHGLLIMPNESPVSGDYIVAHDIAANAIMQIIERDIPGWRASIDYADDHPTGLLVQLLRDAGCKCERPLLGHVAGIGPRCRLCNVVTGKE